MRMCTCVIIFVLKRREKCEGRGRWKKSRNFAIKIPHFKWAHFVNFVSLFPPTAPSVNLNKKEDMDQSSSATNEAAAASAPTQQAPPRPTVVVCGKCNREMEHEAAKFNKETRMFLLSFYCPSCLRYAEDTHYMSKMSLTCVQDHLFKVDLCFSACGTYFFVTSVKEGYSGRETYTRSLLFDLQQKLLSLQSRIHVLQRNLSDKK